MFSLGDHVYIVDVPNYDDDDLELVGTSATIDAIGEFQDWKGSTCQFVLALDKYPDQTLLVRNWQIRKIDNHLVGTLLEEQIEL